MRRKIFLDLEETLIDDWSTRNFLAENAKHIFRQLHPSDELNIFSFAIWNEKDLKDFNLSLREPLEKFFMREFAQVPTFFQIFETVKKFRSLDIGFADFSSIFPKHLAFIEFIRATESEGEFWLFDDMVEDWDIFTANKKIIIRKVG